MVILGYVLVFIGYAFILRGAIRLTENLLAHRREKRSGDD